MDNFRHIFNEIDEHGKKVATNILIITTVDNQDKVLSCLTPTNTETVFVNLNDKYSSNKNINKQSLPHLVRQFYY